MGVIVTVLETVAVGVGIERQLQAVEIAADSYAATHGGTLTVGAATKSLFVTGADIATPFVHVVVVVKLPKLSVLRREGGGRMHFRTHAVLVTVDLDTVPVIVPTVILLSWVVVEYTVDTAVEVIVDIPKKDEQKEVA